MFDAAGLDEEFVTECECVGESDWVTMAREVCRAVDLREFIDGAGRRRSTGRRREVEFLQHLLGYRVLQPAR